MISCKSEFANKHYQSAYQFEEQENYEKAIEELNKAIELNPKFAQAYLDRGIDKAILGDYEGGIEDMTKFIQFHPNSVEPYVWRSEYKRNLERYNEALLDIDTAFMNKPGTIERNGEVVSAAELNYSHPYIENENYDLELEYLFFEKGVSLVCLGKYEEAMNELDYVVDKRLNDKDTRYYRGVALLNLGYLKEACHDLSVSAKAGDKYSENLFNEHCKKK